MLTSNVRAACFTGFALLACGGASMVRAQQVVDLTYDTRVARPAYKQDGPRVFVDEAHRNFHTARRPIQAVCRSDLERRLSRQRQHRRRSPLRHSKTARILVIANATGEPPANSAFTDAECDAVHDWVRSGGSLLLIADHAPYGSAASALGRRFGVDMSATATADEQNYYVPFGNPGFIVYKKADGRIADHAITTGRDLSEAISTIMTFTGQSLKGPAGSVALLMLADTARDRVAGSATDTTSAAGRAQAIAFPFGRGSIVGTR